jgi:serine protease Do
MGSVRTWSLALAAGIFVLVVAQQRSNADAGPPGGPATATPSVTAVPTSPAPGRVTGLPDFSGLVAENSGAVVNIAVIEKARKGPNVQGPGGGGGDEEGGGDDPLSQFFRRFGVPGQGQGPGGQGMQPRQMPPSRGIGSGFIVSTDGYVLTNAHVVADASVVRVKLNDRREFDAKVIGIDKGTDIALIKIPATNLPVVHFGDPAKIRPGQWAIAIGSPFGFESSVTAGVVSALGRPLPADEGVATNYVTFIQTDAAVNPGNSGGPLFNVDGQVIGINSQIYSRTGGYMGVSFAIPIDIALNVKEQLQKNGKVVRSRIGVAIQDIQQQLALSFGLTTPHGALVSSVEPGSPGEQAGLKPGDVITSVNGRNIDHSWDLPTVISQLPPGSSAKLGVWHDKKPTEVTVKTIELKDGPQAAQRNSGSEEEGGKLGLALRPLQPNEQKELHTKGKLVVEQVAGPALAAGLQQGDVVLGVNGASVATLADLKREVAKAGHSVALLIQREDAQIYVPIDAG